MNDFETAISTVPSDVSFGYSSVHLFRVDELEKGQIGFSVSPKNEPLWGDADGDWHRSWVVIGLEGECGDPIFVDTADPGYTVYTAWHGEGRWDPKPIAVSIVGFREALQAIAVAAQGRGDPVALERNPITAPERDQVIESIRKHNPGIDPYFWKLMLGDDLGNDSGSPSIWEFPR